MIISEALADKLGKYDVDYIKEKIEEKEGNKALKNFDGTLDVWYNGHHYKIDKNGNVSYLDDEELKVNVFAKLYSSNDGSGDVLILSNNSEDANTDSKLTLKSDYGNIGNEKYEFNFEYSTLYDKNSKKDVSINELKGNIPPWLEKKTDESTDGTFKRIYYEK